VDACFDGSERISLAVGDKLEIRRSAKRTVILKLSRESFLEVLHNKMNTN
jgi:NAD+ kinase